MEEKKKYPASSNEYKREWLEKNRERINLAVPLGFKDKVKKKANEKGKSLNSFIVDLVKDAIEEQ